jgi:hypothetical protein
MDHKDLAVGISGIVLEQAGFALADMFIRAGFSPTSLLYPEFFKYKVLGQAAEGYIPSNTDLNLASITDPGLSIVVDQILEYRDTLRARIMGRIGADITDFDKQLGNLLPDEEDSSLMVLTDWLVNSHPGRAPNARLTTNFGRDKFTRTINSSTPTIGEEILNMDVSVVGGSGVLLDIDIGEIIYQPYPYIAGYDVGDFSNPYDRSNPVSPFGFSFENQHDRIPVFPIYPSFQKTDGSTVSIVTHENGYLYNGGLGSGGLLFWGGIIFPSTSFKVGIGADLNDQFTPLAMNLIPEELYSRRIIITNSNNLSGIVIQPPALGTGVYKIGVENTLAAFPDTALVSGFISIFPRNYYFPTLDPKSLAPSGRGYEVFNDAFWAYVVGGMITLSPYTGRSLHFRRAEYMEGTEASSYDGGFNPRVFGSGQIGLFKVNDEIITVSELMSDDTGPGTIDKIAHFQKYNTNLEYVSEVTTPLASGMPIVFDAFRGGDTIYVTGLSGLATFDTSLAHLASYIAPSLNPPLSYFNGKLWGRSSSPPGFFEITLNDAVPAGSVTGGTVKTIDISALADISSISTVFHGIEVTGSTSDINGVWLWVQGTNAFMGTLNHWLIRATEDVSEFVASDAIMLRDFDSLLLTSGAAKSSVFDPRFTASSTNRYPKKHRIIHMDVN